MKKTTVEVENEYSRMVNKLANVSDEDLKVIWYALCSHPGYEDGAQSPLYNPEDIYDGAITMEFWAMNIYSEMSGRGLPIYQVTANVVDIQDLR